MSSLSSPLKMTPIRAELPSFLNDIYSCRDSNCGLSQFGPPVHSRGNWKARVMNLGEGPGKHEKEQDAFFVGAAGQEIDKALTSLGLDPNENFFWHNIVLCRPEMPIGSGKENRPPTKEEIACCRKHLERVIKAHSPDLIVLIGGIAAQAILKDYPGKVTPLIGQFFGHRELTIDVDSDAYVIWHPAYILRNSDQRVPWMRSLVKLRDYMLGRELL